MCDQGKKDRADRNGTTRNGSAPASRGCHYLPVDCQNLKCYNGSTSQATHDGQSQKGVGKCNGVDRRTEALYKLNLLTEKQLERFILSVKEEQHQGVLEPFQAVADLIPQSSGRA